MDDQTLYGILRGIATRATQILGSHLSITTKSGGILNPKDVFFYTAQGCILVVSWKPEKLYLVTPWGITIIGDYMCPTFSRDTIRSLLFESSLGVQQRTQPIPIGSDTVQFNVVRCGEHSLPHPHVLHLHPALEEERKRIVTLREEWDALFFGR